MPWLRDASSGQEFALQQYIKVSFSVRSGVLEVRNLIKKMFVPHTHPYASIP